MARIPDQLQRLVIERAQHCCEYCQAQEDIMVFLEIDHIVPQAAGGETTLENLCFACRLCNSHKHSAQTATDPETGEEAPLYNPRAQDWSVHFAWSEDGTHLLGLTATGRATIARLKINTPRRIRARQRWVAAGWHPPTL